MSDVSYVRTEMLPESEPPASTVGLVGWMRENLFKGVWNSVMTVISILVILSVLNGLFYWAVVYAQWSGNSLNECREGIASMPPRGTVQVYDVWAFPFTLVREFFGGLFSLDFIRLLTSPLTAWREMMIAFETAPHTSGACWPVIRERWLQLMFGFYPSELYWRPILAFILLLVAVAPVLFNGLPRKMLWFSALFPFLMPWLLWGGTIWTPVSALIGFVLGYFVFRFLSEATSDLIGLIGGVVAAIVWWVLLSGGFSDIAQGIVPISIESVGSRDFGGFMLSITIGVVAIGCSFPIGIFLALGRRSDLLIVKSLCVGFIEFIRGVPLITLLFVASTLLNIFLPPGTDFDIILRVFIMVTLFAAAYMAEVIRGGLAALPTGQYEAADALGLDYWKAQRLIIMPQALKISIPGIVSTFIGIFKDTTLVSIIALFDPLNLSTAIRADSAWNGIVWELYGFIAVVFFILCFAMSRYSMYLERKLQTGHK